ncbi:MAG: PspC domain-containing protein [Lachnospiraceae bacterium]|nr:PspC domain-containing protein [Lachnospiraceae bacterium]
MEPKKLTRPQTNRVIAGVCAGIGNYFNVDPVVVRICWVLFSLMGGTGLLAYLVCLIIMPEDDSIVM